MIIYLRLFLTFFLIGGVTIGGGAAMIPLIRQQVLQNGWMTEEMLINVIGIAESTPGPIVVNLATYIGSTQGGVLGSLCATLGVVLPSFIIIVLIARFFQNFLDSKPVNTILKTVRSVVVGLIIATGAYFIYKVLFLAGNGNAARYFDYRALIVLGLLVSGEIAYKVLKKKYLPPILIICVSAVLGMVIYAL
jgi:Chromate transport protein ChrA